MKRLLILGVVTYVVYLLASFPAALAVRWLSPEGLQLAGIGGSVWSGAARSASANGLFLGELQWRARPWTLLLGRVGYRLRSAAPDLSIDGIFAMGLTGKLRIDSLTGSTRLSTIAPLLPPELGAQLADGRVELELDDVLVVDQWPQRAAGAVTLSTLELLQPQRQALGNYRIELSAAETDEGILGEFRDVEGPLEITGTLVLRPDRSYEMQCTASARSGAPEFLRTAAGWLCPAG